MPDIQKQPSPYVLAIDSGGTKCAAMVVDSTDGRILRSICIRSQELPAAVLAEPAPFGYGRSKGMAVHILTQLEDILTGHPFFYANNSIKPFEIVLGEKGLEPIGSVKFPEITQARHSEYPLCDMVLAAGTGFAGTAWKKNGKEVLIDAMGPLVGDWGGAYYIGRQFLRLTYRKQSFSNHLLKEMAAILHFLQLPVCEDEYNLSKVFSALVSLGDHPDRSRIAALSQVCGECARGGSELARQVLVEGGMQIAESACLGAAFSGLDKEPSFTVMATGSVLERDDIVYQTLRDSLAKRMPNAVLHRTARPQICGAVAIGLETLLKEKAPAVIQAFFENYLQTSHN